MSDAHPRRVSPTRSPSILEAFWAHLRKVERRNWEDKLFYHPNDIKKWMNAKQEGDPNSNVVKLVGVTNDPGNFEEVQAKDLQHADNLLVFAVLLHPKVNCGKLIHIFMHWGISDSFLRSPDMAKRYEDILTDLERRRSPLPNNHAPGDYHSVIKAFDKFRWAFCPVAVDLHMNIAIPKGPCVLPFVREEVVNQKGGTANVHRYQIQEDIVPDALKEFLEDSRHDDPKFGSCYEFAVKSYYAGWEDVYNRESKAFKGIRNNTGFIRYLGEYRLTEEETTEPSNHIILEYGQLDLDEYLAQTYPPVLNAEIITFWEDIFQVADTIKRLHQLQYKGEDGSIRSFKGWHGDIKPDNILRVRNEFKLADFGFAKFEIDEIGKATTFLSGGTRTYGAPECDYSRQGTRTPHLQTIDTWSFGCVLSAVATWVILGSQAYDNYREVRKRAIAQLRVQNSNGQNGTAPLGDAFHDGVKVLPVVTHWHNFLRSSSRRADTITYRVLDLVDEKMLQQQPGKRLTFEQLCDKLDDIVLLAKAEHQKSTERGNLEKVEPDILEALLGLDRCAPASATPIDQTPQRGVLNQTDDQASTSLLPQSQSHARSNRVGKSERLEKVVIGKTANREQAIKSNLKELNILPETQEICDSPQQLPLRFVPGVSEQSASVKDEEFTSTSRPDVPQIIVRSSSSVAPDSQGVQESWIVDDALVVEQPSLRNFRPIIEYSSSDSLHVASSIAPSTSRGPRRTAAEPPIEVAGGIIKRKNSDRMSQTHNVQSPLSPPPDARDSFRQRMIERPGLSGHTQQPSISSNFAPLSTPPTSPGSYAEFQNSGVAQAHNALGLQLQMSQTFEIFKEHDRLKSLWRDKKGPFSNFLNRIPVDPVLKNFISDRDIVFVVDNADSMMPYWNIATLVVKTLAMKIGPLDKDGLDLMFTLGNAHGLQEVKGWDIPLKFGKAMEEAGQDFVDGYHTNMAETLRRIFEDYDKDISKKMTLIILTDGLWRGSDSTNDVEKLIAKFITKLNQRRKGWESRWFSIQFISFGDDEAALKRLEKLDDEMPIEDVIDTKPWSHFPVDHLILGSIIGEADKNVQSPSPLSPAFGSPGLIHTPSLQSMDLRLSSSHSRNSSHSGKKHGRFSKIFGGRD